jgi:hypothetical protein
MRDLDVHWLNVDLQAANTALFPVACVPARSLLGAMTWQASTTHFLTLYFFHTSSA